MAIMKRWVHQQMAEDGFANKRTVVHCPLMQVRTKEAFPTHLLPHSECSVWTTN
jgi:hypothetical protein